MKFACMSAATEHSEFREGIQLQCGYHKNIRQCLRENGPANELTEGS